MYEEEEEMILESIFSGSFCPAEQLRPEDPEYWEALKSMDSLLHQLSQKLPPEDYETVESILSHYSIAAAIECESHFKFGFSAGLTIQQEAQSQLQYVQQE